MGYGKGKPMSNAVDTQKNPPTQARPAPERSDNRRLAAIVVALTGIITLMLLAFLTPSMNSGPKDLPLAVSGPAPAVQKIEGMLEQKQPGAFDVNTYDNPDEVKTKVLEREAIGGISLGKDGTVVTIASGAGSTFKQIMTGLADGMKQQGQKVSVEDVAPLPEGDPNGIGLNTLALPLAFGGMASAALLTFGLKGRRWGRVVGAAVFSILAGLALGAIMQFGYDLFDGNYLELAGILALGIAGTSMFVLGMESLLGGAGLGIGAIITLFVSNPLSGIATGWQWLPSPWGWFGQHLPIGAAGTAVRSVAYFDDHGITHAVVVLCCWVALGVGMVALASWRKRRAAK